MKTGDFLEKGENKAIGKGGKCPLFPALLNLSTCKYVLKIQGLFKSKHGLCISFFFFFFLYQRLIEVDSMLLTENQPWPSALS